MESVLTWGLRALADEPHPPRLRPIMLLDRRDRAVPAEVVPFGGVPFGGVQSATTWPEVHLLGQNYPNPFNPQTTIPVVVGIGREDGLAESPVRVEVFDALGRSVSVLWNGPLTAGTYTMQWDGRDRAGREVASGIYVYRLQTGATDLVKRMLLVR